MNAQWEIQIKYFEPNPYFSHGYKFQLLKNGSPNYCGKLYDTEEKAMKAAKAYIDRRNKMAA